MYTLYKKRNKKTGLLTQETKHTKGHRINTNTEHNRLINLTNITFNKEHINALKLGQNYAIEKNPKYCIN
jgi:hypothetical protein